MAGFVREHAVDIVGAPAIIGVIHHQPRSADRGVGKVTERIFGEERDVSPIGVEFRAQVVGVLGHIPQPRAIAQRCHCRIAPMRFFLGESGIAGQRRRCQFGIADLVDELHRARRILRAQPAEPVLHLCDHLQPFGGGELERIGGPFDDNDGHRDPAGQARAGWCVGVRLKALGIHAFLLVDNLRAAQRLAALVGIPGLARPRPIGLRLGELVRLAQGKGFDAHRLFFAERFQRLLVRCLNFFDDQGSAQRLGQRLLCARRHFRNHNALAILMHDPPASRVQSRLGRARRAAHWCNDQTFT